MYSENRVRDLAWFVKAIATNLIARFAPTTYVRLTGQTGRGAGEDDVDRIAAYFEHCYDEYRQRLGLDEQAYAAKLQGLRVLEYGPGDVLGVALLFYAAGARHVHCVDRFPLEQVTPKNARVYRRLLDRLDGSRRARAEQAFVDAARPELGFRPDCIEYRVTSDGLAGRRACYDLIVSRAVLEHVHELNATLADVEEGMAEGGVSLHSVDLRSHNLDRDRPFDFLTWPRWAYRLMYSHKGFPNRWRSNTYRALVAGRRLRLRQIEPTGRLPHDDVERIRPHLARELRDTPADELGWLGLWIVLERAP